MNPEGGYDAIKLSLADTIRSVMLLARQRQRSDHAAHAQELLARLAEDRFQLAVVGRFNSGKSSLMNAILGQPLLPTGIRPLTSVITNVCYGSRPGIEVSFRNGTLSAHGAVTDLVRYATEDGNPANAKGVRSIVVQAPIETLRQGFYFVDTPGVGSDVAANTATTERFLPDADAVIFVTSFDSPIQDDETDFLLRVRQFAGKIFYVVNKSDLVEGGSRERILNTIRDRIRANAGDSDSTRIFAVSATDALAAKLHGEVPDLTATGLPGLESALWEYLTDRKSHDFLTRVLDRSRRLLDAERLYVNLGRAGKAWDGRQALESQFQQLSRKSKLLLESANAKIRSELPSVLQVEMKAWREGTVAKLRTPRSDPHMQPEIGPALVDGWNVWVDRQRRSLVSQLVKTAKNEVTELLGLAAAAKTAAAGLLDVGTAWSAPPAGSDLLERIRVLFPSAPEPPEIQQSSWWRNALSFDWLRAIEDRAWLRATETAMGAYADEVRNRTVEAGLDWIERLFREASNRFHAEVTGLLSALESKTAEADERTLNQIEHELQGIEGAIRHLDDRGAAQQSAVRGKGSVGPTRCHVCARLAEAVYGFLAKEQYALATDSQRQAEHAREGAFCTLHAWQYESIASPQGVCLAYAAVLDARASELRTAASGSEPAVLSHAVEAAFPAQQGCRICRFIAEQERGIASEIAARLGSTAGQFRPGLCIVHLRSVLEAGLRPEIASELVRSEAETLERCARDMRMYALKHDAVRRELATEEEQNAHYRGLALVAGERTIARPWPKQQ